MILASNSLRPPRRPRPRRAALVLACALLLGIGQVWIGQVCAGLMPMGAAIADFGFHDGVPDYAPSLADGVLVRTPDNSVRLIRPERAADIDAIEGAKGRGARLLLRGDTDGASLLSGAYNGFFGSLNPADTRPVSELTRESFLAMGDWRNGLAHGFLLTGRPLAGREAIALFDAGLWGPVSGIPDEQSVELVNRSPTALVAGTPEADRALAAAEVETPLPGTALLLLAGLPWLLRHTRPTARA